MAIANIKVTLLCPIEKVWNKVTDLSGFGWRGDIKDIKIIDEKKFYRDYKRWSRNAF